MRLAYLVSALSIPLCGCHTGAGDVSVDAGWWGPDATLPESGPDSGPKGGDAGSSAPAPHVLPGGGIANGPIDGVVYVYAIDDVTRLPIAGASVAVGGVTGTTDATGLFTAAGVTGAQDIVVTATGYRAEAWLGANGADVTIDLRRPQPVVLPGATLSGTIDLSSFSVPAGHTKTAVVTYSRHFGDPDNALPALANTSPCTLATPASQACTFSLPSPPGTVALVAAIVDDAGSDTTSALLGWAYQTGLVVTAGEDQTGLGLDVVAAADTIPETFELAPSPTGLPAVEAMVGIDLGQDGVIDLPLPAVPSGGAVSLAMPNLALFTGTGYVLTAVAAQPGAAQPGAAPVADSFVRLTGQTGQLVAAKPWLAPPADVSVSRTQASWTPSPGALVDSIQYFQGANRLLDIVAFDGRTTVDVPASVALPAGATAIVTAWAGPIDLTSFALDLVRASLTGEAQQPAQATN